MKLKYKFKGDCNGRPLKTGDRVRVCAIPDLSPMPIENKKESLPIFRYSVGKKFIIENINEYGCASLNLFIPTGEHKGIHTIYVETWLLKKLYGKYSLSNIQNADRVRHAKARVSP